MFLCLIGAILNIFLNKACAALDIPLYLDTVLTVTVTLAGGLVWGSLCGALTNIVNHTILFWGWEGYLFALCNIATAVITWFFKRSFPAELRLIRGNKQMDRVIVLLLLSFALCIVMSVLGGLLTALILGIDPALIGEDGLMAKLGATLHGYGFPLFLVEILSRIPVNIIDRLITVFGGYGIALAAAAYYRKVQSGYVRRKA